MIFNVTEDFTAVIQTSVKLLKWIIDHEQLENQEKRMEEEKSRLKKRTRKKTKG